MNNIIVQSKFKKRKKLAMKKQREKREKANIRMAKILNFISPNEKYTKIKYLNKFYKIGDDVLIRSDEDFYIAKILRIIPLEGIKKFRYWPSIEIKYYYRKNEINRHKNGLTEDEKFNSLSDYELFDSEHKDVILIERVSSKCKIVSIEDYEKMSKNYKNVFFCRAKYDVFNSTLIPPFMDWEKTCLCNTPINPDQMYIICDKCEKWFHPIHCGLKDEDVQNLKNFYCYFCRNFQI